jgi:CubicO group peptidase (beta-lactamase class C family)
MHDVALLPDTAAPPVIPAGPSPLRDARMRAALRRHVHGGMLPGFAALVHHKDREFVETFGTMKFGGEAPIRRDTIFRLASMTKPITAVAAMILLEECRIRLDDPVDPWLPELKERKVLRRIDGALDDTVPARRPITVRDLLTFRCGYGEVGFLAPGCPWQGAVVEARLPLSTWPVDLPADEFMRRLGALPLACQPGERWLYHMGSEILGVLIARVTGGTLGAFMRERIFEPLGMKDTGFSVPARERHRLPACYGRDPASGDLVVLHEGGVSRAPVFESGGGGLVSTLDDLLAFGQMLLHQGAHGGERILSRAAVELMTTDQLTPAQKALSPFFENFWEERGWGLGVSVVVSRRGDLASVPGRFGWDGAFGTSWYVDPKEELIGIFLAQRTPDVLAIPAFILDFWNAAYQLIED